jgi:TonB family protein
MHPFFVYLIQVNIALSVFFILYAVVLKRDTFLQLRRLFFLSVIVFSLLYPLIIVPLPGSLSTLFSSEIKETGTTVFIGEPVMEIVSDEDTVSSRDINWARISMMIYFSIMVLFIFRFLMQLISIHRIRVKSELTEIHGIPVYRLKDDITPFSFFNLIFIHTEKHSDTELTQILLHELTHVRQVHSVDILLIESLCVLFWWNPFVWMLKREMAMNLEYLADNGVLIQGVNSREYQYHLLRLTYHETAVPIVNNFNVSQLKQRIMMMNQSKSPANRLGRYLLILPLALLFVTGNSMYAAQRGADEQREQILPSGEENMQELAQSPAEVDNLQNPPPQKKKKLANDEIFVVVENQPEFPGGNEAMMKFLSDSVRYPVVAQQKGIQGRVICNFVVMKDGSISDVQIVRGVDPLLDAEAVRVLKLMPDWKPGKQRGQNVNVRFTLPVIFRLTGGNESKVIIDELRTNEGDLLVQASVSSNFVFPGEENGLFKFVSSRIKYPVIAQENGGQGLVDASFKVDNTGNITDVKIESGENAILNKEVLRVIKEMPQWVKDKTYLVSGRVTDSDLQPLQGTSIILKGTNMGTITDANGNFQIKVPGKEGSLVFSFIGYKTTEVPLSNIKTGNGAIETKLAVVFRLQGGDTTEPYTGPTPDNAIVVVGYGSKKLPEVNDPR